MIELTRLNGSVFYLNPDMILSVEAHPDTTIKMTNGDKLIVKETPQQITDAFVALKRRITVG